MGITLQNGPDFTLPTPVRNPGGNIFRIGEVLQDTYEIRSCLGEGGMSQVFEAHDRALNRRVAIKASWPHPQVPPLRKEAQALAVLRHPNMAVVHALGCHRGVDYLVMERIYGMSLKEHLLRRGRLKLDEVIQILTALAQTLDAVHRAGVVHRDVKPANVMLAPSDRIVLVDFGIFAAEFELSSFDTLAGTPQYLAPELIAHRVRPGQGPLVDMYALGITAWEMLTGRLPFDDVSVTGLIGSQLNTPMPDVRAFRPDVPERLAALIAAMTDKDPDARPQSMEEALNFLRPNGSSASAFTVMVIDDHGATLDLLRYSLSRALPDAKVLLCASAEEAIEVLQRQTPDVLTIDLEMPGMNGIELCLYLRGARLVPDASLIVVSGRAQAPDVQLLGELGVHEFIWKGAEYATKLVAAVRGLERYRRPKEWSR